MATVHGSLDHLLVDPSAEISEMGRRFHGIVPPLGMRGLGRSSGASSMRGGASLNLACGGWPQWRTTGTMGQADRGLVHVLDCTDSTCIAR